jgi:hypothetical protein
VHENTAGVGIEPGLAELSLKASGVWRLIFHLEPLQHHMQLILLYYTFPKIELVNLISS